MWECVSFDVDRILRSLSWLAAMASPIKLFDFFQKTHQTIGIHPFSANPKKCSIYSRNELFLIGLTQTVLASGAFLALEATSMFDYGFGFLILISIANPIVVYLLFMWKSESTLNAIKHCEGFIEQSESILL